jgi:pyruvate dehydrogenase E1 component alpha subunit
MGERYRTREEIEAWKKKDPISRMAGVMLGRKAVTRKKLAEIDARVTGQIDRAVEFALKSPPPEGSELYEDLFV